MARNQISEFARELLGGNGHPARRNVCAIAGALTLGFGALYVQAETSKITIQDHIVLAALVHELARKTGEDEKKIWMRVTERAGVPVREWYYQDVIDMLTQEIQRAKMDDH